MPTDMETARAYSSFTAEVTTFHFLFPYISFLLLFDPLFARITNFALPGPCSFILYLFPAACDVVHALSQREVAAGHAHPQLVGRERSVAPKWAAAARQTKPATSNWKECAAGNWASIISVGKLQATRAHQGKPPRVEAEAAGPGHCQQERGRAKGRGGSPASVTRASQPSVAFAALAFCCSQATPHARLQPGVPAQPAEAPVSPSNSPRALASAPGGLSPCPSPPARSGGPAALPALASIHLVLEGSRKAIS